MRSEKNTRGHALVVMLAYQIIRHLRRVWKDLNVTVEEGLDHLGALCTMRLSLPGCNTQARQIPRPNADLAILLKSAKVRLPDALPSLGTKAVTRRILPERRVKF